MTRRRWYLLAFGLLILLYGCAPAYRGAPILGPLDTSAPEVALGERVFAANCNQCHPGGGRGIGLGITNKPLPDWVIRFQVRNGLGEMPAFSEAEISSGELDAIVAYTNALRERLGSAEAPVGEPE